MDALPASLRPRLLPGCLLEPLTTGWALRHRAARRTVVLDAAGHAALSWLDGQRTVEDLAFAWCREHHTVEVEPFLRLLTELCEAGLLAPGTEGGPAPDLLPETWSEAWARRLVYSRHSERLRRFATLLAGPLIPLLRLLPLTPLLLLAALSGAALWLELLTRTPCNLLQLGGSYWLGLVVLLTSALALSFVQVLGTVAVARLNGQPVGLVSWGVWYGLPQVRAEVVAGGAERRRQRAALHLAGPLLAGAVSALLALLSFYAAPGLLEQALLLAATVGFGSVFVALGPGAQSAFSHTVSALSDQRDLRFMARSLTPAQVWRALGQPTSTHHPAALHALGGLLWLAFALHLLRVLVAPQLPFLLADAGRKLPYPDLAACLLLLVVLVGLAVLLLTWVGAGLLLFLVRQLAGHRFWRRGGVQLVALLLIGEAVVAGLRGVSEHLPHHFGRLALALGTAGAVLTWAATLLVLVLLRGRRLGAVLLPLALATLAACLVVAGPGRLTAVTLRDLTLAVSFLIGVFAWSWLSYLWRWLAGYVGLAALTAAFALGLLPSPLSSTAALLVTLLTAAGAGLAFVGQARSRLATLWALTALSAALPVVLEWSTPPAEAATETTVVMASVAMLLGGGLLQLYLTLVGGGLRQSAPLPAVATAEEPLESLLAGYRRLLGPAARAARRAADRAAAPGDTLGPRAQRLHAALLQVGQDLAPRLASQLLRAACERLPWAQQLQVVGELGLEAWLSPPRPLSSEAWLAMLASSLLLAELTPEQREQVAQQARLQEWADSDRLLVAGAPARRLVLLVEGHVALTQPGRHAAALASLEPGDTFGLEALLADGRYPYTATALGPCRTLALEGPALAVLAEDPGRRERLEGLLAQVRRLRPLSALQDLAEAQLGAFLTVAEEETFHSGDCIVRQGDPGDRFYLLTAGEVEVSSEREGQRQVLATLGAGEYFGELALLFGVPRTATVTARTPVRVLCLARPDFLRLFPANDRAGRGLQHLSLARVLQLAALQKPGAE